jgi:hypothetical protein
MVRTSFDLVVDVLHLVVLGLRSHARLAAENLFLRKQLALYVERQVQPRRATNATRLTLIGLARVIDWRPVLTIVQPDTLIRWHRHAFRLFWRWKSRPRGRPRIPADVQQLIADIAKANRTWGEERIAAELLLKLVSPCRPALSGATCAGRVRSDPDCRPERGARSCAIMLASCSPATSL